VCWRSKDVSDLALTLEAISQTGGSGLGAAVDGSTLGDLNEAAGAAADGQPGNLQQDRVLGHRRYLVRDECVGTTPRPPSAATSRSLTRSASTQVRASIGSRCCSHGSAI
jgi:hypothetical protein